MKRTIFIIALSIAGFIGVWRYEPGPLTSTAVAAPQANTAAPSTPSTVPPSTSAGDPGSSSTSTTDTTSSTPPTSSTPSTSDSSASTIVVEGTEQSSQFGTVQVQVSFSGTKITDIRLLKAPSGGPGVGALPTLQQEALQAQNANIDTVSGATQTSDSYKASLQAAIDARGA